MDETETVYFFPGNVAHFPSLREVNLVEERLPEYAGLVSNLNREFDVRFVDFKKSAGDMELFSQPFNVMFHCLAALTSASRLLVSIT